MQKLNADAPMELADQDRLHALNAIVAGEETIAMFQVLLHRLTSTRTRARTTLKTDSIDLNKLEIRD
jgi:hypothetical protein